MSKSKDVSANEALAHQLVEQNDPQVSAMVGFHALIELAHTMAQEKFAEFIQGAIQEAQQTHTDFSTPEGQPQQNQP